MCVCVGVGVRVGVVVGVRVGVGVCEEKNVIFQHRTLTVWTSPSIQPISLSLPSLSPNLFPSHSLSNTHSHHLE